jgi:hypothetical protein
MGGGGLWIKRQQPTSCMSPTLIQTNLRRKKW